MTSKGEDKEDEQPTAMINRKELTTLSCNERLSLFRQRLNSYGTVFFDSNQRRLECASTQTFYISDEAGDTGDDVITKSSKVDKDNKLQVVDDVT